MTHLYGIPNCSTVKKARVFLEQNGIEYQFHDFKKETPSLENLQAWLQHIPLDILINKRGTTWRKLSDDDKQLIENTETAITLMQSHPSIIKRPVLVSEQLTTVGFKEEDYQQWFLAGKL